MRGTDLLNIIGGIVFMTPVRTACVEGCNDPALLEQEESMRRAKFCVDFASTLSEDQSISSPNGSKVEAA
jgi:hypothetical protein